ncbi:MAG: hypothetical protein ACYC63_19905 [Armatimonadota bacterium]
MPIARSSQAIIAGPRVQSAVKAYLSAHPKVSMTRLAMASGLTQGVVSKIVRGDTGDQRTGTVEKLQRGMKKLRAAGL